MPLRLSIYRSCSLRHCLCCIHSLYNFAFMSDALLSCGLDLILYMSAIHIVICNLCILTQALDAHAAQVQVVHKRNLTWPVLLRPCLSPKPHRLGVDARIESNANIAGDMSVEKDWEVICKIATNAAELGKCTPRMHLGMIKS